MSQLTWPWLLAALLAGHDLDADQTRWAMDQVMDGEASQAQLAGFLVALRAKGETVTELTGLVEAMLAHAVRIEVPGRCVDVVGTGGDRHNTVNISTMAAIVVAGAGVRVVKHGNRSASSACGSADLLEGLGIRLDLPPARVAEVAVEAGITFCFAQAFHPAMRHAAVARRELGVPTVFNFLGPLTNPAQPGAGAVGVADARMAPLIAGVMAARGDTALVFRGDDGLDELATTGPSTVWTVRDGSVSEARLEPADVGLPVATVADLRGGDVAVNTAAARSVLAGDPGPVRDAVVLNAGAGLVAAGLHDGAPLSARLVDAMAVAAASVDSGAAAAVLDRWVAATR